MIYAFGTCELDLDTYELRRDGEPVRVEPQVFDVLVALVRGRDHVVTKDELLDTVWGDRFVSDSAVTSRIKAARHACGDTGRDQRVIRTVHGRGYQFVAPVEDRGLVAERHLGATPLPPQQIRFCTSPDGVRLAYASMGEGPVLVKAANWLSHLDYDRETVVWHHWLAGLSSRHRLIRYDERGCGLSDWDVPELTFESWVRDLEVVVDAAGVDRFPLLGISQGGPVAIAYATRHPERVTRLVLLGPFAQGRRVLATTAEQQELAQARIVVTRYGWGQADPQYRQIFASRFLPEGTQEEWRQFDELQRRSTSAENAARFLETFADIDVVGTAPDVQAPTLIACARHEPENRFDQARLLATLIPNSRLLPLDSCNHLLPERDPAWPVFLRELHAFLAE